MHRSVNTAERFFRTFSQALFLSDGNNSISTNGILLIKNFEGKSLTPYLDDDKSTPNVIEYSIGYGHQIKPGEEYLMQGITDQKAEDLLIDDLASSVRLVNNTITVDLTQAQFDALVSYAYNIGSNAFKTGTLVSLVNSGASLDQIQMWWLNHYITASGVPSPTLASRRAKEFDLYSTDVPDINKASLGPEGTAGKIIFGSIAALALIGAWQQRNKKKVA